MSKHDTVPLIAKRLETKETTDQLIAAFRVFDKQNRGVLAPTCSVLLRSLTLNCMHLRVCLGKAIPSEADFSLLRAQEQYPLRS